MRVFNTIERYGAIAALLHWIIAVLIVGLLALGLFMHDLPQASADEVSWKIWLYSLHKTFGIATFFLVVLRIVWAFFNTRPAPLHPERKAETLLAEIVHWGLYVAILATPLAGWIYHAATEGFAPIWWPFSQDLPLVPESRSLAHIADTIHAALGYTIIGFVSLHVLGALKHTAIDRDGTLARMVPGMSMAHESAARARMSADMGQRHFPAMLAGLAIVVLAVGAIFYIESAANADRDVAAAIQSDAASADAPADPADGAALWQVDRAASTLAITVAQNGTPTDGVFRDWNADIRFDPENLEASSVRVEVQVGSLEIGDVGETATSLLKAGAQPVAVWSADEFRQLEPGRYEAVGTLELAGRSAPLNLPFALQIEGGEAEMQSETTIQRLDWGVGEDDYPDGGTVGLEVTLRIGVEATRQ